MKGAPPNAPPKGKEFLEAAIRYARRGFRVLPLRVGGKEPLIKDWPNKATTDEAQIREWWRKWPNANIGIATGRYRDGYFCVLDFDPRNGGDWYADAPKSELPDTWVVHTARGGRHYYYKTAAPLRNAILEAGVDLKGEGGYVVAPPSILLDEKGEVIGEYVWEMGSTPKEAEMAEVPSWVWGKVLGNGNGAKGGGGKDGAGLSLWLMPPPIPKGMRHSYLVSLAGALLAAGLTEKEIERVLWAALELLETLEGFDPVAEIKGILKGLQKWEGETYTIGSLLRMLPEKTVAVVRRALTGGGGASEPAPTPTPTPTPAADGVAADGVAADAGGEVSKAVKADGGGGEAASLAGDGQSTDGHAAKAAEATPVADGQGAGGQVGEVAADTGQSGGKGRKPKEGAAKEKKGRKSKTADLEDIKAILWRYKWVKWQGELWQVTKPTLYKADLDRLHGILKQNGLEVGKETLKSYMADIMASLPKGRLEGLVVTPQLTYGEVGNLRGLWCSHRGDLYLVTPDGRRVFSAAEWPEGVYALDTGEEGVLPDWDGEVEHLLKYWEGITPRLVEDALVALAMFLPVLFGQGDIGLILKGDTRSGKSTLRKSLAYLRFGEKPDTPSGLNMRDLMAVLHRSQIVFFDEVNTFSPELQETLKRMITHDKTRMRALYTNLDTVVSELKGSAVFCTTQLERIASDLRTRCFVWHLEEKEGAVLDRHIQKFCSLLWAKALGGAVKLYQQSAKLKPPPNDFMPEIRFRDWLSAAYRYAMVLGVPEKRFMAVVRKSKRAAHRGDKYEFLIDAISHEDFDPRKEYTISDLIALGAPSPDEVKNLRHGINRESVRADLAALALDMGYNLRIEKKRGTGEKKERYRFIFTPLQTQSETDRLRKILQSVGIEPDFDPDWAGDVAPTPEVHPPTPAPQIALTDLPGSLSELKKAVQKAPPAEVGGGAPMAPPAPEKPMAIAVQSAPPLVFSLPPLNENERVIAELREALARLPKPEGLLRQGGRPIEGWVQARVSPEQTEYLRALAGSLAAEAAMAAEKGRFAEAGWLWACAGVCLWHLIALTPTREAIAALFLSEAVCEALYAAEDPGMQEAAGGLAKVAEAVFFGKAAPDVLLRVLLETPLPTEYDPVLAPHYRKAVGYLVAAYWGLTGRDPNILSKWLWAGQCERDEAEAMLLFSLGRQKMGRALDHLYLGDLPF
jgi:hypothetical protein